MAVALGVLVIVVAVGFFFLNRPNRVNVTVEGTQTPNPVAAQSPPPTVIPPTLQPSAKLAPTDTSVPAPTPTKAPPTPPPAPTKPPAPTSPPPAAAQPAAGGAATPVAGGAATPVAAGTAPSTLQAPAPATPPPATPTVGPVANPGGAGNPRSDFDSAYGPPTGETPEHLVVYRKNNVEYHAAFAPDPNGRAAMIVALPQPQPSAQLWTLEQAMAEARKLLPKDAQPPNPRQEGNDQFVVERYTSQSLAQALPAEVFTANKGQPGQFLVVYVREAAQQGRISRLILGPGDDPQALINQGR